VVAEAVGVPLAAGRVQAANRNDATKMIEIPERKCLFFIFELLVLFAPIQYKPRFGFFMSSMDD
jgi:hypothetical protein